MPDYVIHIGFISPPRRELSEGQGTFHMAVISVPKHKGTNQSCWAEDGKGY